MRNLAIRAGLQPSDVVLTSAAVLAVVATSIVLHVWGDETRWAVILISLAWLGNIALFSSLAVIRRRSLAESGAWVIVLGAVIAIGVIAVNEFTYPFDIEKYKASGLQDHTRFHFFVAGSYALVGIASIIALALGPLRKGQAWAWWAIAASTAIVLAADIVADASIYFHELHFLIVGAWITGLALARQTAFRRSSSHSGSTVV